MMGTVRRNLAGLLWLSLLAPALAAQQVRDPNEVAVHAYTLKHRRAADAIPLISRLLSPRGAVELQPGTNTVVVRDTLAALGRVVPALRNFDLPARQLTMELQIVRASRAAVSPPVVRSDLPEELTRRLREMLNYDNYRVQTRAQLALLEGQSVTYEVGGVYEVSFRVGTVSQAQQVQLSDFRISRRVERKGDQLLAHTNMKARLGKTTFVGLARDEASPEALIVLLTVHPGEVARRP